MKPAPLFLSLPFMAMALTAYAEDEPPLLESEYCFPTEGIAETLEKFDSLKASKRDTVGADFAITIKLDEGEIMPQSIEVRDGETVTPVPFDDENRSVGLPDLVRQASETAQVCVVDPAREGRPVTERGYQFNVGMGVRFKSKSGAHTMEEIEDGLKDGRSHYKKLVGAMGFMVPKFDHIAVAGSDDDNPPRVWATAAGADLGEPGFTFYDGARMIEMDVLEEMGADGIRIEGDYRMSPSPDAETVKKFAGGDSEDDEDAG